MREIVLNVRKDDVWEDVAKRASYTGDRMKGDPEAYDRLLLTDDDKEVWGQLWEESVAVADGGLRHLIREASAPGEDYRVRLEVSVNYDTALNGSVEAALRGYFAAAVTGRWFRMCDREDAEVCMKSASALLEDALRKLYSRRPPRRGYVPSDWHPQYPPSALGEGN